MATWPSTIDDDGSSETGTGLDDAFFDQVKLYIDDSIAAGSMARLDLTAPGTYHNINLPARDVVVIDCRAAITIGGFANIREGQRVYIRNSAAAATVTLLHASGGSARALYNFTTSAATYLEVTGAASYVCVSGYYCLTNHEQGARRDVPFSAANFSGMTVEAGDQSAYGYTLKGRLLFFDISIIGATIGTAGGVIGFSGMPYQFFGGTPTYFTGIGNIGGGWFPTLILPVSGAGSLQVYRLDGTNFAVNTNATALHISGRGYVI